MKKNNSLENTNNSMLRRQGIEQINQKMNEYARFYYFEIISKLKDKDIQGAVKRFEAISNIENKSYARIVMAKTLVQCLTNSAGYDKKVETSNIGSFISTHLSRTEKVMFSKLIMERYLYFKA